MTAIAAILLPVLVMAPAIAGAPAAATATATQEELAAQVRAAETACAKSMADRNHAAFVSHLSDEAVFFSRRILRGKTAVAEGWKPFFDEPQAPFSWEPEQVQVLDSGTLAFSAGPVRDTEGHRTGTFNSVWRREAGGEWKIVFDHGCPPCDCGTAAEAPKKP